MQRGLSHLRWCSIRRDQVGHSSHRHKSIGILAAILVVSALDTEFRYEEIFHIHFFVSIKFVKVDLIGIWMEECRVQSEMIQVSTWHLIPDDKYMCTWHMTIDDKYMYIWCAQNVCIWYALTSEESSETAYEPLATNKATIAVSKKSFMIDYWCDELMTKSNVLWLFCFAFYETIWMKWECKPRASRYIYLGAL